MIMSSVLPDGIPTALFTKQSPEQDLTPAPLKRVLTPEEDSENCSMMTYLWMRQYRHILCGL